jgi:hypothetical protein
MNVDHSKGKYYRNRIAKTQVLKLPDAVFFKVWYTSADY